MKNVRSEVTMAFRNVQIKKKKTWVILHTSEYTMEKRTTKVMFN